jgi:hypothetical protein
MAFTTVYEGQISRGYVGNPMGSICQKWQCQDNNFYTSIALWESLEDSTSKDFITFKAEDGSNKYTLLSTNGIAKNFSGQVNLPQTTSNIVIGSIRFQAGNQVLYDLGNGQLGGDGSGYFDYSADNYNLSFNSPPTNGTELKAYFELYYNAGDQIILKSNTNGVYKLNQPFEIKHTLVSNLNPGDSILIKDPVQSMLGYGASDDTLWVLRGAINLNKPAEWFPIPLEKQFIMEDFNSLNFDNWPNINGNISSSCGLNSNALLFDGVSRSIESSYLNLTGQTKLGLDVFNNLNCSPATANDTLFIEFLNNNSNNNWVVMSEMILGGQDERISLKLPSAAASSNTKIRIRQGSSSYIPGSNVCAIDNILFTKKITIGRIKSMQFSSDGNHLFVGSMSGKVLRVSGLNEVYSELDAEPINNKVKCSAIFSAGSRVVTGIGINPNDDDQLIFTLGNYGSYTDYVYYTSNATTMDTSGNGAYGDFISLQFDLPQMPIFDALISNDPDQTVILGTDNGVFCAPLNDLLFGQSTWTGLSSTHGLFGVPVFEIVQQTRDWTYAKNHGQIYLGTHGRGFWSTADLVGIEQANDQSDDSYFGLKVFPNPTTEFVNLEFFIEENQSIDYKIFNLNGQLILNLKEKVSSGLNIKRIETSSLSNGNYFISISTDKKRFTDKFIVQH